MTITIDIPALDRMCAILEDHQREDLIEQIRDEIVNRLKDAAESQPRPVFREVQPEPDHPWKGETDAEQPKPEPTNAPVTSEPPKPAAAPVTLDAVQRAAAQMRDEGKLGAVTGMFGEFGIRKLSDLKGDNLQKFGERLRKMGAKI